MMSEGLVRPYDIIHAIYKDITLYDIIVNMTSIDRTGPNDVTLLDSSWDLYT
jgi:hypothetical protein